MCRVWPKNNKSYIRKDSHFGGNGWKVEPHPEVLSLILVQLGRVGMVPGIEPQLVTDKASAFTSVLPPGPQILVLQVLLFL